MREEVEAFDYQPTKTFRTAPDPADVEAAARAILEAERPVLYAGQGVHYAKAWDELKELAELLEVPVTTSLEGKSAFPENHPLSLGSGGAANPNMVFEHIQDADLIFGVGCSFARTGFGIQFPPPSANRKVRPFHERSVRYQQGHRRRVRGRGRREADAARDDRLLPGPAQRPGAQPPRGSRLPIQSQRDDWLNQWMPKLTSNDTPISPYRVIWDLLHTVDVPNTVITHDAGSPRDQLSPFWEATAPPELHRLGKTTQLGYGLGLAMGAWRNPTSSA